MNIKELKIYSQNFLEQVDFYSNKMGLEVIEKSEREAVFQIGKSKFRIVKNEKFQPYHFAINIPCNQEEEALGWLKERLEILRDGENEIQDFDFWNAMAIYFYDADKNIVELIARKNMKNESLEKFSAGSWLEISEIGMPVNDIEKSYKKLKEILNIKIFDGSFERFCAIGDENGLFIGINKQVKDWFPTGDKAHSSEFEIAIEEKGIEYILEFVNEEIKELNS